MQRLMWGGEDFHRLFNCSFYSVDSIPLERRRNISMGIAEIVVNTIELILYVPCLISIWYRSSSSCYKYMFAMGIFDMIGLIILGVITGIFSISGIVFCSHPTKIYLLGVILHSAYLGENLMEILLAVNRCLYFAGPELALRLFPEDKSWTWIWVIIPLIYGFMGGMFGIIAFYSGIYGYYAFNPHFGYADDMFTMYINDGRVIWHSFHLHFMLVAIPSIYLVFVVTVWKQTRELKTLNKKQRSSPRSMFIQVAIISSIHCLYAFFNSIVLHLGGKELSQMKVVIFIIYWSGIQNYGIPAVIYLSLNKSIHRDVKKMLIKFLPKKIKKLDIKVKSKQINFGEVSSGVFKSTKIEAVELKHL